jgi:hypothetical protein
MSAGVQEAEAGPLEMHAKGEVLGVGVGVESVLAPFVEPQATSNIPSAASAPTRAEMSVLSLTSLRPEPLLGARPPHLRR